MMGSLTRPKKIFCVDNTHVIAHSTPNKVIKECRQCIYFETCTDKLSTDETADWYVKSKCKVFYYPLVAKIVPARQPEVG